MLMVATNGIMRYKLVQQRPNSWTCYAIMPDGGRRCTVYNYGSKQLVEERILDDIKLEARSLGMIPGLIVDHS